MKAKHFFYFLLLSVYFKISILYSLQQQEFTRFAIVIASYNNEKFCKSNLLSALYQEYPNFYVLLINDHSQDKTLEIVEETLKQSERSDLVTIINNKERQGAAYNYYNAIYSYVKDEDVIIILDGDDRLAHPLVLSMLHATYTNPEKEIWMTYGQFRNRKNGSLGFCMQMPPEIIQNHKFRSYHHIPSHLKTFKSWLFKKIKKEDLMYKNAFLPMSWDMAAMLPMIEMAVNHYEFIPSTLVIYNDMNPISDHNVNKELQRKLDIYIRNHPPYEIFKK